MIAYFDTSALIPLVIEDPRSLRAGRVWDLADRLTSVRLIYTEARAALAQAQRMGRLAAQGQGPVGMSRPGPSTIVATWRLLGGFVATHRQPDEATGVPAHLRYSL